MQERSVSENVPFPVTPKLSVRALQNIRAKVQHVQRPGACVSIQAPECVSAKLTVVVRKVRSASLEEIEADRKEDHSKAHSMNWGISGG